jgi:hypothetical protein
LSSIARLGSWSRPADPRRAVLVAAGALVLRPGARQVLAVVSVVLQTIAFLAIWVWFALGASALLAGIFVLFRSRRAAARSS